MSADRQSAFFYSGIMDQPYIYTASNPVRWVDPFGLCSLSTLSQELHTRRVDGHRRFPGPTNSFMRHCVISCEASVDCGWVPLIRYAGWINEMQGLLMHDIPNLGSRFEGRTPWAFQPGDFFDNEEGFFCAFFVDRPSNTCMTCESCCQQTLSNRASAPSGTIFGGM